MSKYWLTSKARCPFYKDENAALIRCDGWVPEAVTHLAFATRDAAKAYKQEFCRGDYEHCAIFVALTAIEEAKE